MFVDEIHVNEKADAENIQRYRTKIMPDLPEWKDRVFTCVICGNSCSRSSSYSNRGSRLICTGCAKDYFEIPGKGLADMFRWIHER